ncbi:hypothetical protein ACFT5B_01010 [Luteimicrobium sp. NPDC057192]|uniref:hypothetical protein n=1 Tax=Luteimicrobium sp. NPDC057192 TaxID=3346042 RepID=UPI003645ED49
MAADGGTGRRSTALSWTIVSATAVVWVVLLVWKPGTEGSVLSAVSSLFLYGVFVVAVVWRIVREAARRTPTPVRRTIRPGVQGLGEVQELYLGRKPLPPPTYAAPEGVVAEAVMERHDPLDDPVWVVGTDGSWGPPRREVSGA